MTAHCHTARFEMLASNSYNHALTARRSCVAMVCTFLITIYPDSIFTDRRCRSGVSSSRYWSPLYGRVYGGDGGLGMGGVGD